MFFRESLFEGEFDFDKDYLSFWTKLAIYQWIIVNMFLCSRNREESL